MTSLTKIVKVTIITGAVAAAVNSMAVGLIVGSSATLPTGDRLRYYSDLNAVGADFAATAEEYKAAARYFSQSPRPSSLAIGRRFATAVSGELLGGTPASLAALNTVTTGAFAIQFDGAAAVQVTGVNLSAAANMNAVAAAVQTRLTAAQAGATIVWTGSRLKAASPTTGAASSVSFAVAPATGTDISALLALDAASGGRAVVGSATETVATSLAALQGVSGGWYGIAFTSEVTQAQLLEAAAWTEAQVAKLYATSGLANNKDAASTTSLGYLLKTSNYGRTLSVYSQDPYAGVSVMAREAAVDYNQPNSIITLFLKQLPGVPTSALTDTEIRALEGNNMNYYTTFGSSPAFANGVMANGTFSDQVSGLDWLQNDLQQGVFAYLLSRGTKVPQTDKGVASIVAVAEKTGVKGLANGLLAAGVWTGDPLGAVNTGDVLPRGFYFYAPPVSSQSAADRATRVSPPISGIAIGAGAIHGVVVQLTYQP